MSDFSSFGSFGQPGTYNSGPADGNYPGGIAPTGAPNIGHSAVVVGLIVVVALVLLVTGVIGLRASGEVVI